jgi:hypothetical protein
MPLYPDIKGATFDIEVLKMTSYFKILKMTYTIDIDFRYQTNFDNI